MKKIKILAAVTVLAVIISCIGCNTPTSSDNPGSSGSSSGSTDSGPGGTGTGSGGGAGTGGGTGSGAGTGAGAGGGTGTGTGGGTGAGAGTESGGESGTGGGTGTSGDSGTESGGSTGTGGGVGTGGGSTETPTLQYEWIQVKTESFNKIEMSNYSYEGTTINNYSYDYYNSEFDNKLNLMMSTSSNTVSNGNTSSGNSETKIISIPSKTGDKITVMNYQYNKSGSNWKKTSEILVEYLKYYSLIQKQNIKFYDNSGNVYNESINENEIELISSENGLEKYKVTPKPASNYYTIYELKDNIVQKEIQYQNGKKTYERTKIIPNNIFIKTNLRNFRLENYKTFDAEGNVSSETEEVIESVTNSENEVVIKYKPQTLTGTSSYTQKWTISTYKRIQVPFSNE